MCIDYQTLNVRTIPDQYTLREISQPTGKEMNSTLSEKKVQKLSLGLYLFKS